MEKQAVTLANREYFGSARAANMAKQARRPTKEQIMETLEASAGIVSEAARRLGYARTTLYNWMKDDPDFKFMVDDTREVTMDLVDAKIRELALKGDSRLLMFYARCFGASRGYVEIQRVAGADGGTIKVEQVATPMAGLDPNKLPSEELRELRDLGRVPSHLLTVEQHARLTELYNKMKTPALEMKVIASSVVQRAE
ncbi:MAG TPA: helix-turn-helix domain-containing protein [Burkholderiaceae bacterium]